MWKLISRVRQFSYLPELRIFDRELYAYSRTIRTLSMVNNGKNYLKFMVEKITLTKKRDMGSQVDCFQNQQLNFFQNLQAYNQFGF